LNGNGDNQALIFKELFPIKRNKVVSNEETEEIVQKVNKMKDLSTLLEEVQSIVKELREEKNFLQDRLRKVEEELGQVKQEKSKWEKDLFGAKSELERVREESREKLNRVLPEIRTLQDQLQDAELQNNLLNIELTNAINVKNEEIKRLEAQLKKYTCLIQSNTSMEESAF